ncbi:MAG: T9SS type B sorting domain-containing protein [Aureispira sp.]|nr:T9SS type B sorting domain-containing protein [Aureispira sp.]
MNIRLLQFIWIIIIISSSSVLTEAQVRLRVIVNSGSSGTSCTDGFFGGGPERHWRFEVAGQGWTTYPRAGICFTNPPNTQYDETFDCPNNYPTNLQIRFRAFEDDGGVCVVSQSCTETITQNFTPPAPGASANYTMTIPNNGSNGSWGTVNFTIIATGAFNLPGAANDLICGAVNLGTLPSNGSIGNNGLSNYGNYCASGAGEPNPWGNDQGVWFQFTTPANPAAIIRIDAVSDPQNLGDGLDLQLAIYESSNGTCTGSLTEIKKEHDGIGVLWDEEMPVECLQPNTTYFVLVDGEGNFLSSAGQEGFFGIEIFDDGVQQAGDMICDAQHLGAVPANGSVGTPNLSQSNVCATNTNDPIPGNWASDKTVWFSFTAPPSGHVIIDAESDQIWPIGVDAVDLQLALYETDNNLCTGNVSYIDSDYSPFGFDEDLDVKCLEPGQIYWILVDGSGINVDGIFDITVTDGVIPPAPHDEICNAIPLGQPAPNGTVGLNNQNNYCADNIFEPIPNNWGNDMGVWYTFVAPPSGKVEVRLDDHGFFTADQIDLQVAVYDSDNMTCTGNLTELKSEHDGIGLLFDEDMEVECLIPGRTYFILVDGEGSILNPDLQEGIFDIEVYGDPRDPPATNDLPCNAIALGDPTGTSVGTTPGPSHPSQNNFCAGTAGEPNPSAWGRDQTVWYTFVAPSTGNVNIDLNSDAVFGGTDAIDLQVAVWETISGTCAGPWREEFSGDDLVIYDLDADVYCLNPGQTYYVQVDGGGLAILGGIEGYFDIEITEIPAIPVATNDLICDAIDMGNPFTGGPTTLLNQHNLCADDIGDPNPSDFGTDKTVWYKFTTPPTGGPYAVNVDATSSLPWPFGNQNSIDLQLAVYGSSNDSCTGSFFEIDSEYDPIIFNESITVHCLEAGHTYFIMVDGSFFDTQGYFDITLSQTTGVPIPTNDLICDHIDLGTVPVGGNINNGVDYVNFCADTEPGEPSPFGIEQTVWFSFIAPNHVGANATSEVTVKVESDPNNVGNSVDLQLAVYESSNNACTGSLSLLEDGDDDPVFSFDAEVNLTCLYPGRRYWVQVDGSILNQEGYFHIEIEDDGAGVRPPYNILCNAVNLGQVPNGGSINNGVDYQNHCSDVEPGEPNPSAWSREQTVWFTFEAPASGNVEIELNSDPNNLGDEIDLQVAAYMSATNSCVGPFVELGSSHNPFGSNEDLTLECLVAGQTYFVQVDGATGGLFGGVEGYFTIEVKDDGGSTNFPYNNDICNAYNFGVPNTTQTINNETNECANVEFGEPGVGNYATNTVWYQFTAPPSGRVEIEVNSTNIFFGMDPEVYLFSSSNNTCTGSFSRIESSNWPTAIIPENIEATCLTPGNTYFIQVDGSGLVDEGTFNISIEDIYPQYGTGNPGDPEPNNNYCDSATMLTVQAESCLNANGTFQQFNYGQPTISYNPAYAQGCNGNCGDTWYSFTMPSSGVAVVEGNDDGVGGGIIGDFSELTVVAYTGTCGNLTPLDCDGGGLFDDVSFEVSAPPGTTVFLQVFNDDGDDDGEDYEICVSEGCGADHCLNALTVPMQPNVPYCFNTAGAGGEDVSGGTPGYFECSEGDNPEHSLYYSFLSDCNGSDVTLHVINAISNGNCLLGITPSDGFNISLFQDSTPCDNNPAALVDCQTFTSCDVMPINWSQTYTSLQPNTSYVIQIDGGFSFLGGDNSGEIMITTTTNPLLSPVTTPLSCSGQNDGTASAQIVSGGVPPFSFVWSTGATDSTITGLAAGTYYVTVTGSNNCFDTSHAVITTPNPIFANINSVVDESCNNACDGAATVVGSGGNITTGYTYLWDANAASQTAAIATGLCAGAYTVSVFDNDGCYESATVNIGNPNPIIASVASATAATCNGICDAQATVQATGGTVAFDYGYTWPSGNLLATSTGLCAGDYLVSISDDNGCYDTIRVVITQPTSVTATIANQTNVACNGDATGSAEILAANGTPTYTYTLYNAGGQVSTGTSNVFSSLTADDYGVLVEDANGCQDSVVFTITEPTALTATLVSTIDVSCNGGTDGEITVQADAGAGVAPYQYTLDGVNFNSTGLFSSLSANNYTVTVRDTNGCTITVPVSIIEPAAINIALDAQTVASCGVCDATANITASGGAGGFTYQWPSGETTEDATGLCSGNNIVTVTDANTCTATLTINIGNSGALNVNSTITQAISCNGDCDGAINITPLGGTAPYIYSWSTGETTASLTGLCANTYVATVSDNAGCFVVETINLTEPDVLQSLAAEVQGVSCNGLSDGQATATPSGGTTAYSYLWDNGETTQTASALTAGGHLVTVSDANSCSTVANVTITEPTALAVTIQNTTPSDCGNTGCNGTATISVSGGAGPYTYAWSNGNTTASPIDLCPNFNAITITDANGCTATDNINIPSNSSLAISIINITTPDCYTDCNGSAIVSAAGGNTTVPYTFIWDDPNAQTSAMATGLCAGTYHVTVSDVDSCSSAIAVVVTEPDSLNATAAVSSDYNGADVSCNGDSDGQATATVVGGTTNYTYAWSSTGTNQVASGLSAGSYIVTVTDANGCADTALVTLIDPTIIVPAIDTAINVSCNGGSDGSSIARGTGGTGTLTYNWSNTQSGPTTTGLAAGIHTVTVSDDNGCAAVTTVVISEPNAITTTISSIAALCNGAADGNATVVATGGTTPYTYIWSDGQTDQTATGLAAGGYDVTVTDANSCVTITSVVVTEPSTLTLTIDNTQNPSCNGFTDGEANANIIGGTTNYTFVWTDGQTNQTATGLGVGTHAVTVTDANGCTIADSATLTEPTVLSVTDAMTPVSCNGGADGSIALTVGGGTAGYTYSWSNTQSGQTATGLIAGVYTATITDANSCTMTITTTVTEPSAVITTATITSDYNGAQLSCADSDDGTAVANANGGIGPYTYYWVNGQTTQTVTGLQASLYPVTITDANGCTDTASVSITPPPVLTISTTILSNYNGYNISCAGGSDGVAQVSANGGTGAYTFVWSDGQTSTTVSGLNPGTYAVSVTDINSCWTMTTDSLTQPEPLALVVTNLQDVNCNGGSDGQAIANPSDGVLPYQFVWSNGETTQTATGLDEGTHTVSITDANGCTIDGTVTIGEPTVLAASSTVIHVNCNGGNDGAVAITATGGTAPYSYDWITGATVDNVTGLTAGTYTVIVTDANGCTDLVVSTVTEPTLLTASSSVTSDYNGAQISCNGANDGTANALGAGGTAPYTYLWSNGQNTEDATGLVAGTYTATIADAHGCETTTTITISEPTTVQATANVSSNHNGFDISCVGASDGAATATASDGTGPYTYLWSDGQTTTIATGLVAGTYTVVITDVNGCTISASTTLIDPAALSLSTTNLQNVSCSGGTDGQAQANMGGGATPYTYNWSNGESTQIANNLTQGTHYVTVTDANGCSLSELVVITEPGPLSISRYVIQDVACYGDSDGHINVTPTGGTPGYSFLWSNGETTGTIWNLSAANYTVVVTDANGCTFSETYTVGQPNQIIVNFIDVVGVTCKDDHDGQATPVVTGGTGGPYSFSWDAGYIDSVIVYLPYGNNTLTVTDDNGCTGVGTVFIDNPDGMEITTWHTNVTCYGDSNATANVTASGGSGPITYQWSTGETTTTVTGLNAFELYWCTVTDTKGCEIVQEVFIYQPSPINAKITDVIDIECNGGDEGQIEVMLYQGSGTPPFRYTWSNGAVFGDGLSSRAAGLKAGDYTVTLTDDNGCFITLDTSVAQPDGLVAEATGSRTKCFNSDDGQIAIKAYGGTPPYLYYLKDSIPNTDSVFTNLSPGKYQVGVIDAYNCGYETYATITRPDSIVLEVPDDMEIFRGETVDFNVFMPVNAPDNPKITWTPSDWLDCDTCHHVKAQPWESTNYVVNVQGDNGCPNYADIFVKVNEREDVFIPSAFSPNGDKVNDHFMVYAGPSVDVVQKFMIFDRWGELIVSHNDSPPNLGGHGWDGTFKGKLMNTGVFVYYIEVRYLDGSVEVFKGDVTLLR